MFKYILKLDWLLLIAVFLLIGAGLTAIYSLGLSGDLRELNLFNRQLVFFLISLVVLFFASMINYRIWKNYATFLYIISIILLILVFVIGKTTNGAVSWFRLGFFNFQPVELVKITLIILLAKYFSQLESPKIFWKHIIKSFSYVIIPFILVILQPDMGSAVILLLIWFGLVFLSGIRINQLLILLLGGIIVGIISWNFVLQSYQKERIFTFINPQHDALGSGYNVIQSMVAIGSGGWSGKGIGQGSQSQLNFIPERHTDFVFATLAEENGFLGIMLILFFFAIIFYRTRIIIKKSKDIFGKLLISGITVLIFFQMIINIGMNIGIVPVTGLSLPFISYGGSFLITLMFLIGIAENIWFNRKSEF